MYKTRANNQTYTPPPILNIQYPNQTRVLDYGLAQHPEFLAEPEYVLALLDILLQLHDDQNYRGLCDRCVDCVWCVFVGVGVNRLPWAVKSQPLS